MMITIIIRIIIIIKRIRIRTIMIMIVKTIMIRIMIIELKITIMFINVCINRIYPGMMMITKHTQISRVVNAVHYSVLMLYLLQMVALILLDLLVCQLNINIIYKIKNNIFYNLFIVFILKITWKRITCFIIYSFDSFPNCEVTFDFYFIRIFLG